MMDEDHPCATRSREEPEEERKEGEELAKESRRERGASDSLFQRQIGCELARFSRRHSLSQTESED
jgi:hypothetical protein